MRVPSRHRSRLGKPKKQVLKHKDFDNIHVNGWKKCFLIRWSQITQRTLCKGPYRIFTVFTFSGGWGKTSWERYVRMRTQISGYACERGLRSRLHESGYFWSRIFFYTNRPFVHTKPMNLLTETASFLNCAPELFKALSTRVTVEICGFKNVRIRFNGVSV